MNNSKTKPKYTWHVISCLPTVNNKMIAVISKYISLQSLKSILDERYTENGWQNKYSIQKDKHVCSLAIADKEKQQWITKDGVGHTFELAFKEAGRLWGIGKINTQRTITVNYHFPIGTEIVPPEEENKLREELQAWLKKMKYDENEIAALYYKLGISSSDGNESCIIEECNAHWNLLENTYSQYAIPIGSDLNMYLKRYGFLDPKKDRKTFEKVITFVKYGKFIFENRVEIIPDFEHYYIPESFLPFCMRNRKLLVTGCQLSQDPKVIDWFKLDKEGKIKPCSPRYQLHQWEHDAGNAFAQRYAKALLELYPSKNEKNKKN